MHSTYLDFSVHQNFPLLRSWVRGELLTVHLEPLVNPPWEPTVEDGDLFVAHRLVEERIEQAAQVEQVGMEVRIRKEIRLVGEEEDRGNEHVSYGDILLLSARSARRS